MPGAQNAPLVFSFNNGNNYTKLPPWRAPSRGTLGLFFGEILFIKTYI